MLAESEISDRKKRQTHLLLGAVDREFVTLRISLATNHSRKARDMTILPTPIHSMTLHQHDEILDLLIDAGFNPRIETQHDNSALHLSALEGRLSAASDCWAS